MDVVVLARLSNHLAQCFTMRIAISTISDIGNEVMEPEEKNVTLNSYEQ
jgi:hypothetical protein